MRNYHDLSFSTATEKVGLHSFGWRVSQFCVNDLHYKETLIASCFGFYPLPLFKRPLKSADRCPQSITEIFFKRLCRVLLMPHKMLKI
jgi:hypothetical protein